MGTNPYFAGYSLIFSPLYGIGTKHSVAIVTIIDNFWKNLKNKNYIKNLPIIQQPFSLADRWILTFYR